MANRGPFPGWPAQQPASGAGVYGGEFRPGTQHGPRPRAPGFRQFPPPVMFQNVYPIPGSPGFNNNFQGFSPYPGGYVASPRATSPNVVSSQSQGYGNGGIPGQTQGQHVVQAQPGFAVVGVPRSNDVRPVKPLFLSWIDESAKDSASLQALDDKSGSVKSSDLYKLVDRVEDSIEKILALTELQNLDSGTEWGVCPFDPRHVVPAEALLRHTLQCPSFSGVAVEASSLLECLQYPCTADLEPLTHGEPLTDRRLGAECSSSNATLSFENVSLLSARRRPQIVSDSGSVSEVMTNNVAEKLECGTLTLRTTRQQFDPRGSSFFYGDAPGVVVTYSSKSCDDAMSPMPHFLRVELEKCPSIAVKSISNGRIVLPSSAIENTGVVEGDDKSHGVLERSMLPSTLWDLEKELERWKDMPSQCSRIVVQAATCLGRVRKASVLEWLLAHSPAYGVVLDVAMAAHISCLVQLYLKALRTQSLLLFGQTFGRKGDTSVSVDIMVLECPIYAEASTWLASWLSHLYGPIKSKSVVLDILKHCLSLCGRFLSAFPLDPFFQQDGFKKIEGVRDEESNVSMEHSKMRSEDILVVKQVDAAMDAVYERANFERYITSWMSVNNATKPQRITSYDMTVVSAYNERAKRRNYHAVCEHDGLTWQRSQQEEKRNKSKAELLAEERDYKRRRMSYRGKKLKRTPLQVLHDIIENHMAEITEAGGIGCFSKQPARTDLESQQQEPGGILSQPSFQHHSGSDHDSRISYTEMAGNAPRLYDGDRETSRSVRTESRPSSERRYDDERHRSYRR